MVHFSAAEGIRLLCMGGKALMLDEAQFGTILPIFELFDVPMPSRERAKPGVFVAMGLRALDFGLKKKNKEITPIATDLRALQAPWKELVVRFPNLDVGTPGTPAGVSPKAVSERARVSPSAST
jgi:hypothetical protein